MATKKRDTSPPKKKKKKKGPKHKQGAKNEPKRKLDSKKGISKAPPAKQAVDPRKSRKDKRESGTQKVARSGAPRSPEPAKPVIKTKPKRPAKAGSSSVPAPPRVGDTEGFEGFQPASARHSGVVSQSRKARQIGSADLHLDEGGLGDLRSELESLGAEELSVTEPSAPEPPTFELASGSEPTVAVEAQTELLATFSGKSIDDLDADETAAYLKGLIEALIFVSDQPVEIKELARLTRIDRKRVLEFVTELKRDYQERGLRVEEIGEGVAFRSNPLYAEYVRSHLSLRPARLSRAQLETLAIVAYRQPITRPEIDEIRGVDAGPVLKGLLERDLVRIIGKKDEPGRPMLYGTTATFLQAFSLKSLRELPTLREFTELNDESRRIYEEKLGESPPLEPFEQHGSSPSPAVGSASTELEPEVGTQSVNLAADLAPEAETPNDTASGDAGGRDESDDDRELRKVNGAASKDDADDDDADDDDADDDDADDDDADDDDADDDDADRKN